MSQVSRSWHDFEVEFGYAFFVTLGFVLFVIFANWMIRLVFG